MELNKLAWRCWCSALEVVAPPQCNRVQQDMLDIVKSALIWEMLKRKKTEPSPSSTSTSRGSRDPSTVRRSLAPCPTSTSSYGDEASLVAADWVRHHAAAPPPGHTSLRVELGVTPESWETSKTQPVVTGQFVSQWTWMWFCSGF